MMVVQKGFTLIEILIAVLVFSIGLLGLAGLQLSSLTNTHSAHMRSVATTLAYDIVDRMRSNLAGYNTDAYDEPAQTQTTDCLTATGCVPADMAKHDAYEWDQALNVLPGGDGIVCKDSTPNDGTDSTDLNNACDGIGSIYAIKVWWADERDGSRQLFVTSVQP